MTEKRKTKRHTKLSEVSNMTVSRKDKPFLPEPVKITPEILAQIKKETDEIGRMLKKNKGSLAHVPLEIRVKDLEAKFIDIINKLNILEIRIWDLEHSKRSEDCI